MDTERLRHLVGETQRLVHEFEVNRAALLRAMRPGAVAGSSPQRARERYAVRRSLRQETPGLCNPADTGRAPVDRSLALPLVGRDRRDDRGVTHGL